jgi:DNA-binding CsgD family transcriptional regulator
MIGVNQMKKPFIPSKEFAEYNLSQTEEQIVYLLLEGKSITDISKQIGISREAIYNSKRRSNVARAILEHANSQMQSNVAQVDKLLFDMLNSPDTADYTKANLLKIYYSRIKVLQDAFEIVVKEKTADEILKELGL